MKTIFKKTGGGCMMTGDDTEKCCDIDYKSNKGEKFTVYTSQTGYRYLPNTFEVQEPTEIDILEEEIKLQINLGTLPQSGDELTNE